jgi:hypothetical protein
MSPAFAFISLAFQDFGRISALSGLDQTYILKRRRTEGAESNEATESRSIGTNAETAPNRLKTKKACSKEQAFQKKGGEPTHLGGEHAVPIKKNNPSLKSWG